MRIWYITRTYLPEKTGGALVRIAQVDYFRSQGATVTIVAPNYLDNDITITETEIRLPYRKSRIRLDQILERSGIYEDYLDRWVDDTLTLLRQRVHRDDCIFATSGGELACIKLGSKLKDAVGCKFVVNLHDPVDYTRVSGRKINHLPHVSREKQEFAYLKNANLVITSSATNGNSLVAKYPEMAERIRCSYFGYMTSADVSKNKETKGLTIVYGGTYDKNQSPELLAKAVLGLDHVEAHFVGNHGAYKPLDFARNKQANCRFVDQLSYPDFLRYLSDHADLGFVSLASPYLGACVPSKIYEYINIGLPILGALPAGDAMDIINSHGFGAAHEFEDMPGLREAALTIAANRPLLRTYRESILKDRAQWFMPVRMAEVYRWLQDL